MAGPYDRLREGRPTDADREWLDRIYGEYLERISPVADHFPTPVAPEQEGELWKGNGPCAYCSTPYGELHYPSCDRPSVYRNAPLAASGGVSSKQAAENAIQAAKDGKPWEPSPAPASEVDGLIERLRVSAANGYARDASNNSISWTELGLEAAAALDGMRREVAIKQASIELLQKYALDERAEAQSEISTLNAPAPS